MPILSLGHMLGTQSKILSRKLPARLDCLLARAGGDDEDIHSLWV